MCIKNYSEVAYFFQGLPTSLCYTLSQIKHFCILVDKENVHLSFQIQNLRGRDQTRTLLFRIHASVCKRQNESVTKMFWIRQESGKISSSVNLVSENREHLKYFRNVDWATITINTPQNLKVIGHFTILKIHSWLLGWGE